MSQGFTILEIMIAIAVMSLGIVGVHSLVSDVVYTTSYNTNRFIASQLAREGIEIVRNIRDSNVLAGESFDAGLNEGSDKRSGLGVQHNTTFALLSDKNYAEVPLKKNAEGFYNYENGTSTRFTREIVIKKPDPDILDVRVIIDWSGKGSPYTVQEKLYNWRK